jgi:nucleotide-binding universal stress UspA family protein
VIAAVDLGEGSAPVIGFAATLARALGAELIALHVISPEEQEGRAQNPGSSRFLDVMVSDAESTLRDLVAASVTDDLAFRCIARAGDPVDEIVKAGTETDSLLVIGMRSRSRVGKFLLGSNLQEILLSSTHPIVAVPIGLDGT